MPSPSHPSQDVETVRQAAGGESVVAVAGLTRVGLSQNVRFLSDREKLAKSGLAVAEVPVRPRMLLRRVSMDVDGSAKVVSGRALSDRFLALATQVMVTSTATEGEPASVALSKGAPTMVTVSYDGRRDVDNPPGTIVEDLVGASQLDLTCLTRSWASLSHTNMTTEDFY